MMNKMANELMKVEKHAMNPFIRQVFKQALVSGLDAHLTGDQEVSGLTPTGSTAFFCGDLIIKYFLWSFSLFC